MYLKAGDAISGKEGTVTAVIDGSVIELAEVKALEATVSKTKAEFKALGHRGTQNKATGWSGAGTMTLYYVSSRFREMMLQYIKDGIDTYFTITVKNEDPTSSIGVQRVQLLDCNIDENVIAKIDVDADFLDEEMAFTFSDVDILDKFDPYTGA